MKFLMCTVNENLEKLCFAAQKTIQLIKPEGAAGFRAVTDGPLHTAVQSIPPFFLWVPPFSTGSSPVKMCKKKKKKKMNAADQGQTGIVSQKQECLLEAGVYYQERLERSTQCLKWRISYFC